MTVLNTIVAEQLNMFKAAVDARIKGGDKKDDALLKELQKLIKDHKAIRFEATGTVRLGSKGQKRGLSNLRHPDSIECKEGKRCPLCFIPRCDGRGIARPSRWVRGVHHETAN